VKDRDAKPQAYFYVMIDRRWRLMMSTTTLRLLEPDIDDFPIRCGTASLGRNTKIQLCIGSPHSNPLVIDLTHRQVIGRGEEASDVDIKLSPFEAVQNGVSRRHAALEVINKALTISDLGSTNGTFINGQQIPAGNRRVVRDGDELHLGSLTIYVFYSR
jgi:hypothetical protein